MSEAESRPRSTAALVLLRTNLVCGLLSGVSLLLMMVAGTAAIGNDQRKTAGARFGGDHEQIIDDVIWAAHEFLAQLRVLRGDAHRAGVEMALAHHNTAQCDQRRGRETHLLSTQKGGYHNVTSRFKPTIGLQYSTTSQIV